MADARTEIKSALDAHEHSIDELYHKVAAMAHCDKERLSQAVARYKAAHKTFHDDALACIGF